ncbi:hypothetical protein BDL97_04G010000 [Sphagnum fallax]|nr:hypothetical protein BDL97_04G010000 [Sphagnum fallax]
MVVVTWWAFWYWACLIMSVEHHPYWVRFEFQFSVFRPARQQQPPMGPGDHHDDDQ